MALSRAQIIAAINASITDPLNRQNTAAVVRAVMKVITENSFNAEDDELTIDHITGLRDSLGDKFTADFVVQLGGGKFLKWNTGETVPAANLTAVELLTLGAQTAIAHVYNFPTASLSGSPTLSNREVGESINLALDGTFNINDGGATTGLSVKKDGTQISASEPYTYNGLVFSKTAQNFLVNYSYAAGVVLNDNLGNPSPYSGGLGLPSGNVNSNTLTALGLWKIWYGAAATVPSTGTLARSLPQSQFEDAGNTFILNTGAVQVNYVLILPPNKTLVSVVDLDALNLNITAEYVLVSSTFTGKDAAGADIANCKKYVKTQAAPYSTNHRHQITIS